MGNPNEANETPAYPQEAAQMNAPAYGAPPPHDAPPPAYSEIPQPYPPVQPYPTVGQQAYPPQPYPGQPPVQPYAVPTIAPQQPYAPQPGAPVIVQPATVVVQAPRFGKQPVMAQCPYCQQQGMTKCEHESGLATWLVCGGCCLFGLWLGCCLIPFCLNDMKDTRHICANCKKTIRVHKILS